MKKIFVILITMFVVTSVSAQEFNPVPRAWKWLSSEDVLFTFDGSFDDVEAFAVNARTGKRITGISAPARYSEFPVKPE